MADIKHLLVVAIVVAATQALSQKSANGCWRVEQVPNQWGNGFTGIFKIQESGSLQNWQGELSFSQPVVKLETWTADIVSQSEGGKRWTLKGKDWNKNLTPGVTLSIEFVAHFNSNADTNPCFGFKWGNTDNTGNPGNNDNTGNQPTSGPVKIDGNAHVDSGGTGNGKITAKYNYKDVMGKSLWFYEIQRSGKLPADKRIPFRGDSALDDGRNEGMDLTGGWYDAGDHVKFGFPMAGSTTMLLYGLIFFKDGYEKAGQYKEALKQFDWPLRYFIKCAAKDGRFYGQLGNGHADHAWWGRPEEMAGSRPAYYVGGGKKGGADIVGETAAALAAGSVAFAHDAAYKQQLLTTAIKLYNLGKQIPGSYIQSIPDAQSFYGSDEWKDDMAHAAAWLSYAGAGDKYRAEARSYLDQVPGVPWAVDWSDKRAMTHWLMYKMTKDNHHKSYIEAFMKEWLPGGSVRRTPKGLSWRQEWGSCRYAGNVAFFALLSAREGIQTTTYINYAKSQIDYMLGDGGRSYVVGFGHNPPQRAHHKAASCPSSGSCGWNNYHSNSPNPHGPDGALVGGPDANDNYEDNRTKYEFTEVATDYNSGYTGALAGLIHYSS